jgi:hypothetical protein
MFIHSGMLTLKEEAVESAGPAIRQGMLELVGQIPGLKEVSIGLSARINPGTASVMFLLGFESEEDWRSYGDHPAHKTLVAEHIAPSLEEKRFFQSREWESRSVE